MKPSRQTRCTSSSPTASAQKVVDQSLALCWSTSSRSSTPCDDMKPSEIYPGMKLYEWTFIQSVPDRRGLNPIMRNRWRVECSCGIRETLPFYYFTRKEPKKSCGHLNR